MSLQKEALKQEIKALYNAVRVYDGSEGKTQEDAINKLSSGLADAFENYVSSITFVSTPIDVTQAAMVANTYPVIASNNLKSKLLLT